MIDRLARQSPDVASLIRATRNDHMVQASRTIKVNEDPREARLDRSLVWHGLVMKAENPLPFVPVITICEVIERRAGGLVREIVDKGDTIREVVTFDPERMVRFERTSGRVLGTILNEIIELEHVERVFDLLQAAVDVGQRNSGEHAKAARKVADHLRAVVIAGAGAGAGAGRVAV